MLVTQIIKTSFLGTLLFLGASCSYQTVVIESSESKTALGESVFNKIWLETQGQKDIWWMKQSHAGIDAPHAEWDELKITVNKNVSPYEVSFQQFKNGKETDYRASCFLCHANGPRAIRPVEISQKAPLSMSNKLTVMLYNFKIKTYGTMKTISKGKRIVPLKFYEPFETAKLEVKTCLKCHNSEGFLSRSPLQRQHSETIRHLVDTGAMPPWPYKLSSSERKELNRFLNGF